MAKYTKKQGSSLWVDIQCEATEAIHPTWTDWTGFWNIVDSTGVVKLTGTLTRSATVGLFQLRIGPVSGGVPWTSLAVGDYTLTYQLKCLLVDYDQEEADTLVITTQRYI